LIVTVVLLAIIWMMSLQIRWLREQFDTFHDIQQSTWQRQFQITELSAREFETTEKNLGILQARLDVAIREIASLRELLMRAGAEELGRKTDALFRGDQL